MGICGGTPSFNMKFILILTIQKAEEKSYSTAGQSCKDSLEVVLFTDGKTEVLRGEVTCLRSSN